ncbi:MAG: metallophosphoesterase, partial [Clostridia bacterium]|nr:metallophosphoesterase [Clostridia bacterium]
EEIRKAFKKKRRYAYLLMILIALICAYLANAAFYRSIYHLILSAVTVALACLVRKKAPGIPQGRLSLDAYHLIIELRDKYSKKLLNALFLGFGWTALVLFSSLALNTNSSKAAELLEFLLSSFIYIEIIIVLVGKNAILSRWTSDLLSDRKTRITTRWLVTGIVLFSVIYWAIVLIIFVMFNTTNIITAYIALGIYALIALAFNLTLRKKITRQNIRINKPRLAIVSVIVLAAGAYLFLQKDVWLIQPYINTVPNISERSSSVAYSEHEDGTGIYTITNHNEDGKYRILQLTDIHLGGSITSYPNDLKALRACFELIRYANPDLVVVTGDLSYPVGISSFSLNNTTPVMQFASFMRNAGIPWAFTYGNHDTEAMAASSKSTLDELYRSLSYRTSKNLLYPYSQPVNSEGKPIMGRNNQVIEVRNDDGSLCCALFLIDSNAYAGEGFSKYDYIRDEQVEWYERHVLRLNAEEGKTVSSLGFFHIPITEYRTAYELWCGGSDEVTYCFGENREGGKEIAKICCADTPGLMFSTAVRLGSTKGFFCGHDHYNNMSLEYQGIRLTYGMSIDFLVEPGIVKKTAQRGATLIVLDSEGEMQLEQIPYESIRSHEDS